MSSRFTALIKTLPIDGLCALVAVVLDVLLLLLVQPFFGAFQLLDLILESSALRLQAGQLLLLLNYLSP
jgi:hypothetical protein